MKKMIAAIALAACLAAAADECKEDGIVWSYETVNGEASVTGVRIDAAVEARDAAELEFLRLPEELGGVAVVSLGDGVLADFALLRGVKLPSGLRRIGAEAFRGCAELKTVTFPPGVTNISRNAFAGCSSLSTMMFLGGEPVVGEGAFSGVATNCLVRASSGNGWSVAIPGKWQGRDIADLAIETYRRATFIYLPSVVGAIGTLAILVLAIVLRERKNDDNDDF